jgi:hypothetical protein
MVLVMVNQFPEKSPKRLGELNLKGFCKLTRVEREMIEQGLQNWKGCAEFAML